MMASEWSVLVKLYWKSVYSISKKLPKDRESKEKKRTIQMSSVFENLPSLSHTVTEKPDGSVISGPSCT